MYKNLDKFFRYASGQTYISYIQAGRSNSHPYREVINNPQFAVQTVPAESLSGKQYFLIETKNLKEVFVSSSQYILFPFLFPHSNGQWIMFLEWRHGRPVTWESLYGS